MWCTDSQTFRVSMNLSGFSSPGQFGDYSVPWRAIKQLVERTRLTIVRCHDCSSMQGHDMMVSVRRGGRGGRAGRQAKSPRQGVRHVCSVPCADIGLGCWIVDRLLYELWAGREEQAAASVRERHAAPTPATHRRLSSFGGTLRSIPGPAADGSTYEPRLRKILKKAKRAGSLRRPLFSLSLISIENARC